jgi:hypothetical protein
LPAPAASATLSVGRGVWRGGDWATPAASPPPAFFSPAAMPTFPPVDESLARFRRAGRCVGDAAYGPPHALFWQVTGSNGENAVLAYGSSQAEAWWRACEQARAVGMLAPPLPRER